MNSNYIESTRTLKNVTLVAGEGEGSDRKTTTVYLGSSAASGLDRREIFTDASGVSKTVEGGTLSDTEYLSQLVQKGNEELSNNTETVSFEGEVDISATYTYDEDYFLGDVVQVGNEFGNEARCRITEFVRSQDETGNEYYPTFETLDDFTENNPFAIRLTKVSGSSIKVDDRSYTKTNTEPVVFIPWNLGNSTYTAWIVMGRTYEAIQGTVSTPQYCVDMQVTINGRSAYIKHLGKGMYDNYAININTENFSASVNPVGIYTIGHLDGSAAVIDDFDNYWLQFAESLLYAVDGGGQQVTLPSGYQRLNYLQSSGTQYIDTGFNPNQDTRVVATMEVTKTSIYTHVFGSRENASKNTFSLIATSGASVRTDYGTLQGDISGSKTNEKFTVDKNKNITSVSNCPSYSQAAQTFSSPLSLAIFANHSESQNNYIENAGGMKVYSFKIYDNGTLIRDFIPCINPSLEYGLYDVVNNQFYGNAGTGSFTGG